MKRIEIVEDITILCHIKICTDILHSHAFRNTQHKNENYMNYTKKTNLWRVHKFLMIKKYNDSGYVINDINKSSSGHISKPNSLPLAATRYCSTHQNKFLSGTLASENLFDISIKNLNSHLHILCCVCKWSFIVILCKATWE